MVFKCETLGCKKEFIHTNFKVKDNRGTPENDGWTDRYHFCSLEHLLKWIKEYSWSFTTQYLELKIILYDKEVFKEFNKEVA